MRSKKLVRSDYYSFAYNKTFRKTVVRRCSVNKLFLEISQTSQENTCARFSFLKKRLWHRCFPVNFAKFLRTSFLQNTLGG